MWTQILSISSVLLGLYLIYIFFVTLEFERTPQSGEYHMGCFSTDNHLNHSISIRQYLKAVDQSGQNQFVSQKSFALTRKIHHKYNDISKSIARDFETYLNDKYKIMAQNIFESNFRKSVVNAQEQFKTCHQALVSSFSPEECKSDWNNFLESQKKYDSLRQILINKIQNKEIHQRSMASNIFEYDIKDADAVQKNFTNQINDLNSRLQAINARKIEILTQKSPIQIFIATNKTKLQEDQKLLDECIKNMKIITFCNDLTSELNKIKLTFTKQDIQTKIQRKKFIIESFKNAIRNAQKIGDKQMARISQESLDKNEKELGLLIVSIQSFESFEESYCSKCSDEKITELRSHISTLRLTVEQLTTQYNNFISEEEKLGQESVQVSQQIDNIEEQKDRFINRQICVSADCQEKRSRDLKDQGKVLNELKKQVLDYKFIIEEHKISHANTIAEMDKWTQKLGQVVDCLQTKQYYESLRHQAPQKSTGLVHDELALRNSILYKLMSYGDFHLINRVVPL